MDGNTKPAKAAAYCRVSTLLGQDANLQLVTIRDFARNRPGLEITAEYVDRGVSGTKEKRPQLDQMVRDARSGKFKVLIVTGIDRIGRSTRHLLNLIHELGEYGVTLISLREAIDLSTPAGQMTLTVLGAVAQLEAQLTRERITTALRAKKLAAQQTGSGWRCGRPPVGTPEIIERVLALRAQGLSVRGIEKAMNREVSRTSIHKILSEKGDPSRPHTLASGQGLVRKREG